MLHIRLIILTNVLAIKREEKKIHTYETPGKGEYPKKRVNNIIQDANDSGNKFIVSLST
jgi:hypothetical protein